MIDRWLQSSLEDDLRRPFVHILFGARQTGKSTLLSHLLPAPSLHYNLADPEERSRLLADPGAFRRECEALPSRTHPHVVFVDEAQAVPAVFDAVQVMYDRNKLRWRFVLCGSSARKLRQTGANLLPGRSLLHRLLPLVLAERPAATAAAATSYVLPLPTMRSGNSFPAAGLEERLAYGDLPGVVLLDEADRTRILSTFATVYLEEEIRREALVRDWGGFVNFLRLAARESGNVVNYANISREVGLSIPTIKSYYQLLEDMFVGVRIPAYSGSARKTLLSTPRFILFDLGIRHAASGARPGVDLVRADPGRCFEQWVVLELWKRLQYLGAGRLSFYRTRGGAEIDVMVERPDGDVVPLEVKWTQRPDPGDARHVEEFVREHSAATEGFVVCRCPRPMRLTRHVTAIPWFAL
jgi:predicted AAA+ superfamily ATPase